MHGLWDFELENREMCIDSHGWTLQVIFSQLYTTPSISFAASVLRDPVRHEHAWDLHDQRGVFGRGGQRGRKVRRR